MDLGVYAALRGLENNTDSVNELIIFSFGLHTPVFWGKKYADTSGAIIVKYSHTVSTCMLTHSVIHNKIKRFHTSFPGANNKNQTIDSVKKMGQTNARN